MHLSYCFVLVAKLYIALQNTISTWYIDIPLPFIFYGGNGGTSVVVPRKHIYFFKLKKTSHCAFFTKLNVTKCRQRMTKKRFDPVLTEVNGKPPFWFC